MCADEPELYRVLHQLTAQPLRHRVRVTAITGVTWPELPAPPAATHDQLPALLAWATGLQVGGHTRGHRLTVHCGTTTFTVIHGYGLGLGLDTIAARVSPRRPEAAGQAAAAHAFGGRPPNSLQTSTGPARRATVQA